VHIAYQVVGEGAVDLVFVPPWVSHLEALWEEPGFARMCRRLAAFSRLILVDRRGVGLSDRLPVVGAGDLDDGVADIEAVLDAVGTRRAALFSGNVGGGQICMLFAARRPERTAALVLFGTFARAAWAPDQPWAPSPLALERTAARVEATWGGSFLMPVVAPSRVGDERFVEWWARYQRVAASPGTAAAIIRALADVDVRDELGRIDVPSLVIHRTGDRIWDVRGGRALAAAIPGAQYVELPGDDDLPFVGDSDAVVDAIEQFLTGGIAARPPSAWPARLTDREVDVVRGIARGMRSKQIAAELGISVRTVNHHVDHVYEKTGIRNRAGITRFAVEHGLAHE
jgi:pimeloyl-ACP methyl ester carboxylesterase/DNA-binding CsgD family transcriptional regulator